MAVYLEISDILEGEFSRLPAGEQVPSDREIAERFGINRNTVRAVLAELERRHVVRRTQGAPTRTTRRIRYRISADVPPSYTVIVSAAGARPRTETQTATTRKATAAEASALELPRGGAVVDLRRLRFVDDQRAAWWISTLAAHLVPDLAHRLGHDASAFQVLTEHYGITPTRRWTRLEFPLAPPSVTNTLSLQGRPRIVLLTGHVDARPGGPPLELTQAWLRDDLFDMVMELGQPPTDTPAWIR